ncbi:MAG TPA: MFS transporter [Syntrophomonadaceae bacterium]|nr:MFS transporter [Syntrophomonadaceae bacterium]HOQ10516.1 MFS transporter [Syntrophomonadaceae bacterium]HPU49582.1 MFS transporter [Syntrophomonadaceae bacterium]
MIEGRGEQSLKRYTLLVACTTAFMGPFMGSSINLAIPAIGLEFGSGTLMLNWVVTIYFLASVAFLVPFGRLADIKGRKKIFIVGITAFSISSLLCGLAWSMEMLLIGRVFQGIGSAMLFGTSMAMLTSVFPPQERGRVLGINGTAVYLGGTLGPVLGGALTHNLGWQYIFYLSAFLGFAILGLTLVKLKGEWYGAAGEEYDLRGAALYTAGLVVFIYGITALTTSHWAWYILALGIIILIFFARHELRIPYPILELRLLAHNTVFALSNLAALINYCAISAVGYLLSLFLQVSLGYNSQVAGFILLSQPIVMALVSPYAGRLSDKIEPRIVASTGMGISTLGLFILIFINPRMPVALVITTLILVGLGASLFASPNNNAVLSSVHKQFLGVASSMLGTARLTGQVMSMALVTLIMTSSIGNVELSPAYSQSFIQAARISFIIFTALSLLGILASLARGRKSEPDQVSV